MRNVKSDVNVANIKLHRLSFVFNCSSPPLAIYFSMIAVFAKFA